MGLERWKEIEAVYQSALEQASGSRAAFLTVACRGDDELRREVDALLRQGEIGGLLDRPAWEGEADAPSEVGAGELAPGAMLGPYRIEAYLGAGGMGRVYRAEDTRLARPVAIKISRQRFTERFHREARAIAALNHPNVCTLYDVGPDYLVMEYVNGSTLAARLRKGPLPIENVLRYGGQIADALAAAHSRGIVHRDLKPANVMITTAAVKLLDFGLAKMVNPEPAADSTETRTAEGTVLGTLPYMAPEQIEGQECSARTDIFALGVTLYEMVTGRRAFSGESRASLTAEILRGEPSALSSLQPLAPPQLEHIIRRCMAKEPSERWQAASDIKRELDWVAEQGPKAAGPASPKRRIVALAVLLVSLAAVAAFFLGLTRWLRPGASEGEITRFKLAPPEGTLLSGSLAFAVSPDGRKLVFTASDSSRTRFLWIRLFGTFDAQRLDRTEGASFPFWSPDGQYVAFFSGGKLKKIHVSGGSPVTVCDAPLAAGGTWSREGVILFAPSQTGPLHRISASSGVAKPITRLDETGGEISHSWPQFLPDGRHFLYLARNKDSQKTAIYIQQLDSSERKLLLKNPNRAMYAPPGYLIFVDAGTLFAQALDGNFELQGDPVQVAGPVDGFNVSETALAFFQGLTGDPREPPSFPPGPDQLVWYDREGKRLRTAGKSALHAEIRLSPDEKYAAVERFPNSARSSATDLDLWLVELDSGIERRLSFDSSVGDVNPMWSPDSQRIAFNKLGKSGVWEITVASGATAVLEADTPVMELDDWSPDGRFLIYHVNENLAAYMLPLFGDRKQRKLLEPPFGGRDFKLSPDGQWVAYQSYQAERWEIYVASFPSFAQKRQVSADGGLQPLWRNDGKELFYLARDDKLMSVDVRPGGRIETGTPRPLFQTRVGAVGGGSQYGVSGDGRRFLLLEPIGNPSGRVNEINVVLNWKAGLPR